MNDWERQASLYAFGRLLLFAQINQHFLLSSAGLGGEAVIPFDAFKLFNAPQ